MTATRGWYCQVITRVISEGRAQRAGRRRPPPSRTWGWGGGLLPSALCALPSETYNPRHMQPNPLREGLEQERVPDPSCLVIFGASGDLTQRKLVPGLYSLAHDGLLPSGQTIVGMARAEMTDEQFRANMRKACEEHARTRPIDDAIWDTFAKGLFYVSGEFADRDAYIRLRE